MFSILADNDWSGASVLEIIMLNTTIWGNGFCILLSEFDFLLP